MTSQKLLSQPRQNYNALLLCGQETPNSPRGHSAEKPSQAVDREDNMVPILIDDQLSSGVHRYRKLNTMFLHGRSDRP